MRSTIPSKARGFTLIELVIVLVVVGVISGYALMKNSSSSVYTLVSQANTMAHDIRHVQTLATTWGRSLCISAAAGENGTYTVSYFITSTSQCNVSPVINPVTGAAFNVSLQKGVVLAGPATLVINSLGKPAAASSYTLTSGDATVTLDVAALTGYVTVTP
jgi:MSHA pilin protein MshC